MSETKSTAPKNLKLTVKRRYEAHPERIFLAFTEPGQLKQWFCPQEIRVAEIDVNLMVGGALRVVMEAPDGTRYIANGTYREIRRPEKLVFTWQWETGMDGYTGETVVTVTIRQVDSGSEVVLTHEGLPTEKQRDGHKEGWVSCLEHLATTGL